MYFFDYSFSSMFEIINMFLCRIKKQHGGLQFFLATYYISILSIRVEVLLENKYLRGTNFCGY